MPQQNEIAKRMNKTLMEKSRSMLSDANLSWDYWAEAVDTTCYVVNISLTTYLVNKPPYETWAGKPSLTHLRIFGCDSFVHIPKERRQNLDSKLEKCIFIGYKYGMKGYKLWILDTRTKVYSRDVIFREVGRTYETKEVREKGKR